MRAPETPGELLTILALWQHEHEQRPGSIQQTAVTSMYSQMRDVVDEHRQPHSCRAQVLAAYPDLQQQIWAANAAPHKATTAAETGAVGTSAASEQNPITARDGGEAIIQSVLMNSASLLDAAARGSDPLDAIDKLTAKIAAALAAGGEK